MNAAGRVLIGGADRGAAIAVGPRLAVTAHHVVRRRGDEAVVFRTDDDRENPVTALDANEELDVAALHLSVPVNDWLPVASPVPGAAWKVEPPPGSNDPLLTGTITTTLSIANARGHRVNVLQLHVEQELGDYHGYSGSGVTDRLGRAVVGVLVEQKHLRVPPALGDNARAANVLYAVPMYAVVDALELDVAAAPPILLDAPRPPPGMIDRPDLLDLLIGSVLQPLPGSAPVVRVWGHSGMGKTVLARRLSHDVRVWRAFPGGIIYYEAGRLATAAAVIDYLRRRVETGNRSIDEALSRSPALLVLDDVWDDELVAEVLANLPTTLTVLVTTIGATLDPHTIGRTVTSHHVAEMSAAESRRLLARSTPLTEELPDALDTLASVLGRWALLLDMAAAELHDVELRPDDVTLAARARAIAAAFVKDPTRLDNPESQRRSFDHMMRRALARLTDDDRSRVQRLAIYPPAARLSLALLGDLWELDDTATAKCVRALRRVGLVSVAVAAAGRIVVHDLIMAWLHREYGAPGDAQHVGMHLRLVGLSMTAAGAPNVLTAHRARWLAYHLRHTGRSDDPMRLLEAPWRAAYGVACGTDAVYLDAVREVGRHYSARASEAASAIDAIADRARAMIAGLLHAGVKAVAANLPVDALVVDALLGDPAAALLQASSRDDPHEAARGYVEIVRALAQRDRVTGAVIEQATTLSQDLADGDARLSAFLGLAEAIGAQGNDVSDLVDRSLDTAASLMHGSACRALAEVASRGISADPATTLRMLNRAAGIAETIAEPVSRARAASAVAAALSARQRPTELWTIAIDAIEPYSNRTVSAIELAAIAEQLFDHDADRAMGLFTRAMDKARRVGDGPDRSFACRAVADRLVTKLPRDAATMACEMTPSRARDAALGRVAVHLATVDLALAEKAIGGMYPARRSRAFAAVAAAVGSVDILDRAIASAAPAGDSARNEDARIEVATEVLERYPDRARTLLDGVIKDSASLPRPDRDRVLGAAVDVMARLDAKAAAGLTESIETASIQDHVRRNLVRLLVSGLPLDALPLARRISTPKLRAQAMAAIARAVVTDDGALARDLVADARRSAERIEEPPIWDMGDLVRNLAAIDPDKAAECVERIDYPGARVRPLMAVARARFDTDRPRARADFHAAIDMAKADTWARSRQEALTGIVQPLGECFPDEARRLAEEVAVGEDVELDKLACALRVTDPQRAVELIDRLEPSARCDALIRLATTFATDSTLARSVLRRAQAAADGEGRERARWWHLAHLAVAMRGTDARGAATVAKKLEDTVDNDALRAQLAIAMSRHDARGARSIIDRLTDNSELGLALSELARVQHETDPAAARATLDEATDTCAATYPRPPGWRQTLVLSSSDERPGRALARAGLAIFDNDPAAALAYFARIPEDRGRRGMPALMARVMFPAVHNVTAYTLGGYIDGRGSRANVAGPLPDAQSRLGDMLQYANGFVIALTSSNHPLTRSICDQVAEIFLRLWPRPDWSPSPSGESVSL